MSNARLDRLTAADPLEPAPRLEPEGTAKLAFLRARRQLGPSPAADVYARGAAADLPPASIDAARFVAGLAPDDLEPADRAALFHLLLAVTHDARLGSTRTPALGEKGRQHLRARLTPLIGFEAAEQAPDRIASLVQRGVPGVLPSSSTATAVPPLPVVVDGDHVAPHRLFVIEQRVLRATVARVDANAAFADDAIQAALADVQARPVRRGSSPAPLSREQAHAVARAAGRRLTVVSGGPGTGKTSIVVGLVRTLARLGLPPARILVAAPTGKAAHRATEAVRQGFDQLDDPAPLDAQLRDELPPAETLHRLLGYHPRRGRFARGHDDPLAGDVVIVDEASMIDLRLMDALLAAVAPDAQLVLLGDADQLPSVDAGAILRDLRASDAPARYSVQLTHSFRMDAADPRGANILEAARAVQRGEPPSAPPVVRPSQLDHGGFEQLAADDIETRRRFLDDWVDRHLTARAFTRPAGRILHCRNGAFRVDDVRTLDRLMTRLGGFRLLAVTRSAALATGAEALNRAVHERLVTGGDGDASFVAGEPVMMLRNDYERGLFNGDVGVTMQVAVDTQPAAPMVVFRTARGYEPFPQALLQQDITLAHAMTVHKAQGSEFDQVALILPDVDVPILTREILYTALTRARTSVVIVGAPALTARAVERRVVRHSGLIIPVASGP